MKTYLREAVFKHLPGAVTALCLGVCTLSVSAQTATTILQQNFANGLGSFTTAGTVATSTAGAQMTAAAFSTDGAITSAALSTTGLSNISLTFTRLTAALDSGEGGIAEVSVNNGAFTVLESTTVTTSGTTTVALPAAAANQANLRLRFRVSASSSTESYTVSSLTLTGTTNSGCTTNCTAAVPARGTFATFESGHVRPMALSSNGLRLFVVNTPDNRVEVYNTQSGTPVLTESISVGLEPVAVALASDGQLWVVNHLSDSVSVVDVSVSPARVINTLLVGDEPRDIVFAGTGNKWAFITAAHRGQNTGFDPRLTTAGVGRADVWVYNTASLGTALGGTPATRLNMFGDTLRALAKNATGTRVYAAVFNSGNKSTVLTDDAGEGGITKAPPTTDAGGTTQPETGLIVQKNAAGNWMDGGDPKTGTAPRNWNTRVKMNLPDYDVFTIDTTGTLPTVTTRTSGVGTTLFNIAVNPSSGKIYVSNQEALNLTRFEGPGTRSSTVRGHFVESRITVIDGTSVLPRHLNKHITSYAAATGTAAEKAASLATPLEMALTPDGGTMYVAAMSSNKLARFTTSQLEGNSFTPSASSHVTLTGGLPTGVVLDTARNLAFVTTRGDNGVSVVNTSSFTESAHVKMFNPEPAVVVNGRKFLYDAQLTSSRGDSSCSGCHIFGDKDEMSWDLGNPDERRVASPNTYNVNVPRFGRQATFHPMKGPMTTQSFRGMKGQGPLHWRGDRTGASRSAGETLEQQAFQDFNVAFTGLLGRASSLTDSEMAAFTNFVMEIVYPPSPIGNLDGSWTSAQATALSLYNNTTSDTISTCNGCHVLNPAAGRFGTDGTMSIEGGGTDEDFKIPHLRNMYTKVGMFGENTQLAAQANVGDQIRGFGFDNAGASGTIFEFLSAPVFTFNATQRAQVEALVLAMPSETANIVGQQVTVTPANATATAVVNRLNLLVARSKVTSPRKECEVVAKAVISSASRGWVFNGSLFVPDKAGEAALTQQALVDQAVGASAPITFTCVPPGNGTRIGVDRDGNGTLDRS